MSNIEEYDIAIIGGGPGGYVAAIKGAQLGKKACLIEKNKIGGTCLNVGCIPTKSLLKSAEIYKKTLESNKYGIEGVSSSDITVNMKKVKKRKDSVVEQLVEGVEGLLKENGVDVYYETAVLIDKNTISAGKEKIKAKNIILAAGSVPKSLPIEISNKADLMTSEEALDLEEIPKTCTIIGGGVIGVEFAYFLSTIGTKVTIIEFMDTILPMVDKEIVAFVNNHLLEIGINIETSSKALEIKEKSVIYEKLGEVIEIESEKIIMAVGRKPFTEGLGIEDVGIITSKGAVVTDETLRTNINTIYAIGDINGKSMLAHSASMEGIVAIENICDKSSRMDYSKVPNAIYIQPEIASVGLTEEEAKNKYQSIKVGKFPLLANGKAKVEGEETGIVKVIVEHKTGEILGVHIFGIHATDMIAESVVAMKLEATPEEIVKSIHPHPTVSEIMHEAFHDAEDRAIHFI